MPSTHQVDINIRNSARHYNNPDPESIKQKKGGRRNRRNSTNTSDSNILQTP